MRSRFLAFAFHLGNSMVLALIAITLVYLVWYPDPIAAAVGVGDVFLMMLGIDVVLGPVMTFIVYKQGKKTLVLDLTVIVLIQLAAFGYGLHAITAARPAWLVYSGSRFDLVQANDLVFRYSDQTSSEFRSVPWWGPKWVAARLPGDVKKRNELMMSAFGGREDLPQRPDLYVPLEREIDAMAAKAQPISKLAALNTPESVQKILAKWPRADTFMPLITKGRPLTVLLKKGQAQPIAIVDLKAF